MADYLKTRFLEVISQLLREDGYVTLQSLADKMGVSKRTMQHDVDRVEEWLEENSLTDKVILSKKQGNGIRLTLQDTTISELDLLLDGQYDRSHTYDNQTRRMEIAKLLLFSSDELTFQFLADQFYVSKSVIKKDMEWVGKWLVQYGLEVVKRQNRGIVLSGDEQTRRAAMAGLIGLASDRYGEIQGHKMPVGDSIDLLRLDIKRFYAGLSGNPKADVGEMARIIRDAEKKYDFYLMDSYYTSLLVHLSIAVERLIGGQGTVDKEAYPESVLEYKEGEIASYIAQQIEETFHTRVPDSERAYICIHLMGASLPDPARQDEMHSSRISSFTEHLVSFVEESVGIRFLQDDVLLTSLATHIKTSIFRIQSGMSRPIHYSTHIPAELEPLYHAVWAGNYYYRQVFNLNPMGEEILSVYLHFIHSLRRRTVRCRAAFLYQCDIIRAEEIYQRLSAVSDELEICEICDCNLFPAESLAGFDMAITTGELFPAPIPVLQISPQVTEGELDHVRVVVQDWCHKGFVLGRAQPEAVPCITWTDVPQSSMECVLNALAGLEDRGKYSPAALARERRELDRESRVLICHGTALLPVYLTGIGTPRARGFRLPSPLAVADGKASRLIFLLLDEPQTNGQWSATGYPAFVRGILHLVESADQAASQENTGAAPAQQESED
ncbi:PRD domain-containing protein [Pseudoflavonifractor sp. BIOML-A6]|nr:MULTISPECIES: transcription antiterminator [unclassified Pseudoflavonifractor]MTQ97615.1 PRD domain-containing protein [Pseudoflavonifractor sp. BIOML-A16]MTR07823.1 PRD domain-containing protein [Pseudoflavonifractor sp. BIOML-A15]MTR31758.1 PRD domain-containing protein [Pseudoflavonifractor sp. BIOML-A14]MTR73513.1 PRD domain-containing protein [Pseudoflavonifractor sp. BIOML-A18]MTS65972.1 PRD domain-containing protein [Pseudoflavonifractor sp. BIOML-A5]MTS73408.1 PRD domain-containing